LLLPRGGSQRALWLKASQSIYVNLWLFFLADLVLSPLDNDANIERLAGPALLIAAASAPLAKGNCEVCPIVIQLIVSGGLPSCPLLGSRCLADPDVLSVLGEQTVRSDLSAAELADRFSLVLHDLRMGGAWKRTNRGRLRRTNEMLCAHIPPELRIGLTFLDIGASDGVTTVEAVRALRHAFGNEVRAYLADRDVWLLRYCRGPIVEYRAGDGEPIMVRLGPFGVRLARHRRAVGAGSDGLARRYLKLNRFRQSMRLDARISLVNPVVRGEPGITVLELDCLACKECLRGRVSAVRASNILNLGYFAPPEISKAVGHIYSYLHEGGCFVASRNEDQPDGEAENGSIWQKEGVRLRWLEDFGCGSEIKSIVGNWSCATGIPAAGRRSARTGDAAQPA
jgi:hypothetical protein